jgi:Flp pilus assembly pilin Flp
MYSKGSKKNHQQRGAALVEYSLLVALISIVALTSVREVGTRISCIFSDASSQMRNFALDGSCGGDLMAEATEVEIATFD